MRTAFLLPLCFALALSAQEKRVVITIDDLPCAGCAEGAWEQVTDDLLRVLRAHRVPAIGFVNEDKLYRDGVLDSARYRLLERWLDAGMDLGDHGYAHLGATRHTLAEMEADLVQGERHLRPLLAARHRTPRYYRHPFLQAGATPEQRDALSAMIAAHGYTIAPVTFDNDDYVYAACYEQARRAGARARMDSLESDYVRYMAEVWHFHEAQAVSFFGRAVPHILLLHANTLNAARLDALLEGLEADGYGFIPLEKALADPCYAAPAATTPYGFSWVRRWQLAAGMHPPWPPEAPAFVQRWYAAIEDH